MTAKTTQEKETAKEKTQDEVVYSVRPEYATPDPVYALHTNHFLW